MGKEVASGGDFGSKEEKTFDVVAGPPTAPPTVTSPTIPPPVTSPTTPPPITTPSAPISPTSPTMHPTHTPPTMYPTQTTPTMHPPTSYPTDSPPTIPPTNACKVKGEACLTHSDSVRINVTRKSWFAGSKRKANGLFLLNCVLGFFCYRTINISDYMHGWNNI